MAQSGAQLGQHDAEAVEQVGRLADVAERPVQHVAAPGGIVLHVPPVRLGVAVELLGAAQDLGGEPCPVGVGGCAVLPRLRDHESAGTAQESAEAQATGQDGPRCYHGGLESTDVHYVILGNGIAGIEAALALRRREADARISVVSDEHDHFYSRPALMYVFAGQLSLRDTEPYDRGLYERMRFERVARRVASLDASGGALVLEDGSRLAYDRLLLAVGSKARPAPGPAPTAPACTTS